MLYFFDAGAASARFVMRVGAASQNNTPNSIAFDR